MTPAPLQLGQAPSELALNSAGFTPLAFANALRIGSSSLVYVAGLLRREPLIAAWSTVTTPSRPVTEPSVRELFPDPATPVSTTSTPSGMSASTSCRLWVLAPRTSSTPDGVRTDGFEEARSSRCRPVSVAPARSPSTVPSNTTSPPESVPDGRSSERYPNPISANESRRCCSPVSSGATDGSSRLRTQSPRSLICIEQTSAMFLPLIFEDRASGLSLVPSHSGQVWKVTARSTNRRTWGWSASTYLESIDLWI